MNGMTMVNAVISGGSQFNFDSSWGRAAKDQTVPSTPHQIQNSMKDLEIVGHAYIPQGQRHLEINHRNTQVNAYIPWSKLSKFSSHTDLATPPPSPMEPSTLSPKENSNIKPKLFLYFEIPLPACPVGFRS